jgi:beta-galactosidase
VHVDNWGTYVTTPNVSTDKATVNIVTTIRNEKSSPANILLKTSIIDQSGKILATAQSPKTIKENDIAKEEQQLVLDNPRRWSIEDPICTKYAPRL